MNWSGKALGGLFGALVGGPVGAGVGAAVGHYLGDASRKSHPLELQTLKWTHHAFRSAGPGVMLCPVWQARGLKDVDVTVRLDAAGVCQTVVVGPEHPAEEIEAPEVFVPYSAFGAADAADVSVRLRSARGDADQDTFRIPMPVGARRLGNNGPARVVMALVACARAGGRDLGAEDRAYIRLRFHEAHPLDVGGDRWLTSWLDELASAEMSRLAPKHVARRLAVHADATACARVLTWLMHGTRASWPGAEAEQYIGDLAEALGIQARLDALWNEVLAEPDPVAVGKAAAVLGVRVDADWEDARKAYRALVREWHPDRARSADEAAELTARTSAINAAWAVFASCRRVEAEG